MANLIQALVITSDPQYPWTPCSDGSSSPACPEDDDTKRRRSEELIREQYNDVNSYTDSVPNSSVLINGDITAYGHNMPWSPEQQWDKMGDLLRILKKPYYFGLGNHDIENNKDKCAFDMCFRTSMQRYINHVKSHNLPSSQFDYKRDFISGMGSSTTIESGSFGYAVDFGHIYSIQLNNFPTMKSESSVIGYTVRIFENLNWLEEQLKKARDNKKIIIVNVHKPDDWAGGPNHTFKYLLKEYRVAAVFCGHYHSNCGDYSYYTSKEPSYVDYLGKIPVFLSGSASQSTYLILEHVELKLNIYSVRNNNWRQRKLEKSIPVPVVSGHYKILTALNNSMVLSQDSNDYNRNKNIVLARKNPNLIDGDQKWVFEYDPIEEAYQIRSWYGTPVMVRNVSDNNVHLLHPYPQEEEYYWILEYLEKEDSYIIKNKRDPNYVLDVDGGYANIDTNIKVYQQHDLNSPYINAQKFKLEIL
ncbi:metallophosphoesterase [Brevibacterium sp. JNUCC-42]|nr:metallophosphoesterase [Brevibacterium sp. JNUCC-42]